MCTCVQIRYPYRITSVLAKKGVDRHDRAIKESYLTSRVDKEMVTRAVTTGNGWSGEYGCPFKVATSLHQLQNVEFPIFVHVLPSEPKVVLPIRLTDVPSELKRVFPVWVEEVPSERKVVLPIRFEVLPSDPKVVLPMGQLT